jgi:hypothetical protein
MANKPHLKLNTEKQSDKIEVLKFHYGFPDDAKIPQEEPNYYPMAKGFRRYLANLTHIAISPTVIEQ